MVYKPARLLLGFVVALAGCEKKQPPGQPPLPAPVSRAGGSPGGPMPPAMSPTAGGFPVHGMARTTGPTLDVSGTRFTVPPGWVSEAPANRYRLAQYRLPGPGGPAVMAAFVIGGSIQANAGRWVGQFKNPSGQPTVSKITTRQIAGVPVTVVTAEGTYNPAMFGGQAARTLPNQALYGALLTGPGGRLIVLKATGPKATMQAQRKSLDAFVDSMAR